MNAAWKTVQLVMRASVALLMASLAAQAAMSPAIEPATAALAESMPALGNCLSEGVSCKDVLHLPLLIQLPAYLFHLGGADASLTAVALLWTALLLSCGMVAWIYLWSLKTRKGDPEDWHAAPELIILIFLTGQMLAYYGSSHLENLTAAVAVMLCFSVTAKKKVAAFVLAAVLTVSSDIAFVPAMIFVTGCWLTTAGRRAGDLGAPVSGIVAGLVCTIWFNWIRYSALINPDYLNPEFMAANINQVLSQGLAALISPNSGIVFFWTGILLLMLSGMGHTRVPLTRYGAGALFCCIGLLLAVCAGASIYHQPFGWPAWGNRTLLPWVAGAVALAGTVLARHGDASWFTKRNAFLFSLLVAVFNLPQILAAADHSVVTSIFDPSFGCPGPGGAQNFECLSRYFWPERSILTDAVQISRPGHAEWVMIIAGTATAASATWLLLARNFQPNHSSHRQ